MMMAQESLSEVNDCKAVKLYSSLFENVAKVDRDLSIIDKELRDLLSIRYAHKYNGFSNRKAMLLSIFEGKENAYMLYDMANKAYVEYVIGDRKHNWKQSSLLDLYHRAEEEDWLEIADLAEGKAGEKKCPTAKIVNSVIISFYGLNDNELKESNNSKNPRTNGNKTHSVRKEDDKKQLDDSGNKEKSEAKKSSSRKARSSNNAERGKKVAKQDSSDKSLTEYFFDKKLQELSNLTLKEKKRVLNILIPSDDAGMVAKGIILFSNDDQYDEVVDKLIDELAECST